MNSEPKTRGPEERLSVPRYLLLVPFAILALLALVASQLPDGRLHLWVLDVGQGDAMVLRTPGGRTAVIDGGPAASLLLSGVGEALPFWQRHVDLVLLTHPHDDHLAGLVELASRYTIGQVVQTTFTPTNVLQSEWMRLLQERGVQLYEPARGDLLSFEGEPEVGLRVLSPSSPGAAAEGRTGNNASVVLRLSYGQHTLLLEGDALTTTEEALAASVPGDLASSVLKVAHHGGYNSSTAALLSIVRPAVAVISVGEGNRYGHPSPATLEALDALGARVYRTDTHGTVEIIMDQENMWVRSER